MAKRARKRDVGAIPENHIRAWRKARGLTLAKVLEELEAHGVSMTEGHLSKLERSKAAVDTSLLEALALVLKTSGVALMVGPPGDPLVRAIEMLVAISAGDRETAVDSLQAIVKLARRAS